MAPLLAILYYACARVGALTLMPEGMAIVWLANGLLLAFLLLHRNKTLSFVAAALAAELVSNWTFFPIGTALAFAVVNIGEALLARWLLTRWRFDENFATLGDVFKFLAVAPGMSAGLAAIAGASIYRSIGVTSTPFLESVRVWWLGDAVGLVLITPLVIGLVRGSRRDHYDRLDIGAAALATIAIAVVVSSYNGQVAGVHAGPILLLPFVMFAAARHGMAVSSLFVTGAALVIVALTAYGRNPFGNTSVSAAVVHAQEFIIVMSVTAIGLVAGLSQLRRVFAEVETANAQLEQRVSERTRELEDALRQVKTLSGLLPLCSWCRKLRDDHHYWHTLEDYVTRNTDARITHGICPECAARIRSSVGGNLPPTEPEAD